MLFDQLPGVGKFLFMAMMKSALILKEMGKDRDYFVDFAEEIWMSMEMSDFETLNNLIDGQMGLDIEPYVQKYINSQKRKSDEK